MMLVLYSLTRYVSPCFKNIDARDMDFGASLILKILHFALKLLAGR